MAWNFGEKPKSGTEAALDACDYFIDEVLDTTTFTDVREQIQLLKHKELRQAVVAGDERVVRVLLEALGNEKKEILNMAPAGANTLLFLSTQAGYETITKLLIESEADGRCHTVTRYSPLYAAVHHGHYSIAKMLLNTSPELVQSMTVERWLPLHAACINGHINLVELLISHNYPEELYSTYRDETGIWEWRLPFDPNQQDVTGQTSLYIASILGNKQLVQMLLNWKVKSMKCVSKVEQIETPITPTRNRVSFGIQAILSKFNISGEQDKDDSYSERCPININLLCGAARETALLAAVRGGFLDVVQLLLQNKADPNIVAKPVEDQNDPKCSEEIYGLCNVPISEACKQRSIPMVELLLKYGAKDDNGNALQIAVMNDDETITSALLSRRVHPDLDFKINKKGLPQANDRSMMIPSGSNLTYSQMFPSVPTIVDWHNNNVLLSHIKIKWMINGVLHLNPKLTSHPKVDQMALMAITRIDLSHNNLSSIPLEIFTFISLKYLNLAQNKLESLPAGLEKQKATKRSPMKACYHSPVLEELYLQDNRLVGIPATYFNFPSLQILDISNNKLQELPFDMWNAPKLRELNIAFNLLKDLPVPPEQTTYSSDSDSESKYGLGAMRLHGSESETSSQNSKAVSHHKVTHKNIWSRSLDITDNDLKWQETKQEKGVSQLSSLNIANNLFTSIPPALACLSVNLTRLNMSYNSLRSMGHVTSYPANLKQLDLSHNEITCWPSLPRITECDPYLKCYNEVDSSQAESQTKCGDRDQYSKSSFRTTVLKTVCRHRRHLRLESLRTLILADNILTRIQLSTDDYSTFNESDDSDWSVVGVLKNKLIFPNLSMLDISNNCLKEVPATIHELGSLSVLNISGNVDVTDLPPHIGLLSRLWNLNTRGCLLQEPLRSMIESKKYKTMDIVGYLKSIYEDARAYARMKLMVVGVEGIGKTTLLDLLRQGGSSKNRSSMDHWAKRMGHKSGNKTGKYSNISTVGVDIGTWVCEKRKRTPGSYGPVLFRTWDFGGQKEYYATHQYFLSKRSLYLVLWRITDGHKGLAEILQWLGNIQARAPNSPVIIVGTHYDAVGECFSPQKAEELQQIIREKFIAIPDAEKVGLPRVIDSIEISCRTLHNIKLLANIIYDTAFLLRSPGSKEPLLLQKVPASYIALEDIVNIISVNLKAQGMDPVLNANSYKTLVAEEMRLHNYKSFRDNAELNQATMFLHDNGVLLHYDDATLRDFYFLDPQWLCDMLAHVVTIREINPFAKMGIMKLDDLHFLFKNIATSQNNNRSYVVNLLNKFEVALTWDARTLLIPSLLPTYDDVEVNRSTIVKISQRTKLKVSSFMDLNTSDTCQYSFSINKRSLPLKRVLLMTYFPSGFWSRLITRLLADEEISSVVKNSYKSIVPRSTSEFEAFTLKIKNAMLFLNFRKAVRKIIDRRHGYREKSPQEYDADEENMNDTNDLKSILEIHAQWKLWQSGMALCIGDIVIMRIWEIPFNSSNTFRSTTNRFKLKLDGTWGDINLSNSSILEIDLPLSDIELKIKAEGTDESEKSLSLEPCFSELSKLLALSVDHIDLLLEDWYPSLGTRFVHTSEGRFLITRLVFCPKCLERLLDGDADSSAGNMSQSSMSAIGKASCEDDAFKFKALSSYLNVRRERKSEDSITFSDADSGVGPDSAGSSRNTSVDGHLLYGNNDAHFLICYSWMIEECILSVYNEIKLCCPLHLEVDMKKVAPDVIFVDIPDRYAVNPDNIVKGALLGRGAFGFVFKATLKVSSSRIFQPVAMKMLQPVPPGPRSKESALLAYKIALGKWDRDPLQHSCKAYCTARQELSVLLTLKHPNIVPLVGICIKPLALVLDLAPLGGLDAILRQYRRSGAHINPNIFQIMVLQAAKAIEYLHRKRIIYRDLKSENVLVWDFPQPHAENFSKYNVHIKIADYGISRFTAPNGSKGFGGTEGFMAPEIIRYNGEEEYTEKVDCFSFGMFIYEIITLRQPFEGQESIKECILEGSRPALTQRETQFPSYCLDLMVLCWDESPKKRPSASQIVSLLSAPECIHLLDVIPLSHENNVICGAFNPVDSEETNGNYDLWLPSFKRRIDILGVGYNSNWAQYRSISCEKNLEDATRDAKIDLLCCCIVESDIWIGDSAGYLHAYRLSDLSYIFSYIMDAAIKTPVVTLLYMPNIQRVAVGLLNGRLFLVDATRIPSNYACAEGSFVLTELCSGQIMYSACAIPSEGEYEIWCGELASAINIFPIRDCVVSGHDIVFHSDEVEKKKSHKTKVTKLVPAFNFVFSVLKPGFTVYQWDVTTKKIENKLDCSKLLPCSESLKSISIEEHLSQLKCQITALAVSGNEIYIGTTWGCLVIADIFTLRPITVFRPYEHEIAAIISIPSGTSSIIATIGRQYRSLIERYMDLQDDTSHLDVSNVSEASSSGRLRRGQSSSYNICDKKIHCLLWRAKDWM